VARCALVAAPHAPSPALLAGAPPRLHDAELAAAAEAAEDASAAAAAASAAASAAAAAPSPAKQTAAHAMRAIKGDAERALSGTKNFFANAFNKGAAGFGTRSPSHADGTRSRSGSASPQVIAPSLPLGRV
jgi:hypothetical protein